MWPQWPWRPVCFQCGRVCVNVACVAIVALFTLVSLALLLWMALNEYQYDSIEVHACVNVTPVTRLGVMALYPLVNVCACPCGVHTRLCHISVDKLKSTSVSMWSL